MILYVLGSKNSLHLYFPILSYDPVGEIAKSETIDGKTKFELLYIYVFVHACIELQVQGHTCANYVHRPNNLSV